MIDRIPHTSVELLNQHEILVVGGDSFGFPGEEANSVIADCVSTTTLQFFSLLT